MNCTDSSNQYHEFVFRWGVRYRYESLCTKYNNTVLPNDYFGPKYNQNRYDWIYMLGYITYPNKDTTFRFAFWVDFQTHCIILDVRYRDVCSTLDLHWFSSPCFRQRSYQFIQSVFKNDHEKLRFVHFHQDMLLHIVK